MFLSMGAAKDLGDVKGLNQRVSLIQEEEEDDGNDNDDDEPAAQDPAGAVQAEMVVEDSAEKAEDTHAEQQ